MKDERFQILQMVQEGKVSPEEAVKLLEAVGSGEKPKSSPSSGRPLQGRRPGERQVRVQIYENGKTKTIAVGTGLVHLLLSIPGFLNFTVSKGGKVLDGDTLWMAIENGETGKIFEGEDGKNRLEVWLDD